MIWQLLKNIVRQRLSVGSEKGEKVLEMGMRTPWQGSEETVVMRQAENHQAKDKWDDVSEIESGARAHHLILN